MVVTRSHRFAILLADLYSVSLASDCARYVASATHEESRSPLAFSAAASIFIVLFASAVKRDALGMAGTGPILVSLCCHGPSSMCWACHRWLWKGTTGSHGWRSQPERFASGEVATGMKG